jgi:hypothetical protein
MSYFIAFCSKNSLFVPNLALIVLGDSYHLQGGMKFATQISPLLNYLLFFVIDLALCHLYQKWLKNSMQIKKLLIGPSPQTLYG